MKYLVTILTPEGATDRFSVCRDTYAEAEKYVQYFCETYYKSSNLLFSVTPKEDSPKTTARMIFDMPSNVIEWIEDAVRYAVLFINESNIAYLSDYGYDEEAIATEGRLKVDRKIQNIHDTERSNSLCVISFDGENIGWYIGSGRGERDRNQSFVTDANKVKELSNYLFSKNTDYSGADIQVYDLDEHIPNMYDWLIDNATKPHA